jgi:hypothetical protein
MKKVFSIWSMVILMTMSVGFSSCSKDDDEGDKGGDTKKFSELLVGKWKYHSYYNADWIEVSYDSFIQFNSDGSVSFRDYQTWEVTGKGGAAYGEYGESYKVVLKGDPYNDDVTWDICIIGKNISPQIDDYDYPDVLAVLNPGTSRFVRVK